MSHEKELLRGLWVIQGSFYGFLASVRRASCENWGKNAPGDLGRGH